FLRREDVEEQREVSRVSLRSRAEVLRRTHGDAELRVEMTRCRRRKCISFVRSGRSISREQSGDFLTDAKCVRIWHEETNVVPELREQRVLLKLQQHLAKNGSAPRV